MGFRCIRRESSVRFSKRAPSQEPVTVPRLDKEVFRVQGFRGSGQRRLSSLGLQGLSGLVVRASEVWRPEVCGPSGLGLEVSPLAMKVPQSGNAAERIWKDPTKPLRPEARNPLSLGHFQLGSYRYRSLVEALQNPKLPTCSFL